MPTGIGSVVRGFWQGAKKLGRAASAVLASGSSAVASSLIPNTIRVKGQGEAPLPLYEQTSRLEAFAAGLLGQMGADAYYALPLCQAYHLEYIDPLLCLYCGQYAHGDASISDCCN